MEAQILGRVNLGVKYEGRSDQKGLKPFPAYAEPDSCKVSYSLDSAAREEWPAGVIFVETTIEGGRDQRKGSKYP